MVTILSLFFWVTTVQLAVHIAFCAPSVVVQVVKLDIFRQLLVNARLVLTFSHIVRPVRVILPAPNANQVPKLSK
jgi:hypothetical protein